MASKFTQENSKFHNKETIKRNQFSWKRVTEAENYFLEGKTGNALPILFKYENCEARAMLLLAYMYFEGYGTIQDMNKGISYLQKLVRFDNYRHGEEGVVALALYYLGELYYKGFILEKDDALAERYWLKGAKLNINSSNKQNCYGKMKCQTALGMFYSYPNFFNSKKTIFWHKKANELGSLISRAALGIIYMYGIGTKKNIELAYSYLTDATAHGNTYAKGYLAAFYYKRKMFERAAIVGKELAVEEDFDKLVKQQHCPKDHVLKGVAMGCYYLALCTDRGGSEDSGFAKKLIKKAIHLSPEIAYDIHAKSILGTA